MLIFAPKLFVKIFVKFVKIFVIYSCNLLGKRRFPAAFCLLYKHIKKMLIFARFFCSLSYSFYILLGRVVITALLSCMHQVYSEKMGKFDFGRLLSKSIAFKLYRIS
jgi:hypothetical protein